MEHSKARAGLIGLGIIALLALPSGAAAHRLPKPPRIELLASLGDPENPLRRTYIVQVIETASGKPITLDEPVRLSARNSARGLDADAVAMQPTGAQGVYGGRLSFPAEGRWQVRVEIVGIPSEPLAFEEVAGGAEPAAPRPVVPAGDPELWDGIVVGYLIRQWGHLLGFAFWFGALLMLRFGPVVDVRVPLILLWGGLILAHGTALDKMWYSTPPSRVTSYIWNYGTLRNVPMAGQYTWVLLAKQVLAVTAVILAVPLTRRLLRAGRAVEKHRERGIKGLIDAQVVLALGVAGLAVTLDMLHKIVDHFLG